MVDARRSPGKRGERKRDRVASIVVCLSEKKEKESSLEERRPKEGRSRISSDLNGSVILLPLASTEISELATLFPRNLLGCMELQANWELRRGMFE